MKTVILPMDLEVLKLVTWILKLRSLYSEFSTKIFFLSVKIVKFRVMQEGDVWLGAGGLQL
jgi:hypothetical protein